MAPKGRRGPATWPSSGHRRHHPAERHGVRLGKGAAVELQEVVGAADELPLRVRRWFALRPILADPGTRGLPAEIRRSTLDSARAKRDNMRAVRPVGREQEGEVGSETEVSTNVEVRVELPIVRSTRCSSGLALQRS